MLGVLPLTVGWIWGLFVCAKPMSDLTLVIRSPFLFVPVTGGQPLVIRRAFLSAFNVVVDAAAGRVTGRVLTLIDSDD